MGPAIALRLRQHLTLTPQVQQALRLLQMSALEFAQEMEQALAAKPFLEENPETPVPAGTKSDGADSPEAPTTLEEIEMPQAQSSGGGALTRGSTLSAFFQPRTAAYAASLICFLSALLAFTTSVKTIAAFSQSSVCRRGFFSVSARDQSSSA